MKDRWIQTKKPHKLHMHVPFLSSLVTFRVRVRVYFIHNKWTHIRRFLFLAFQKTGWTGIFMDGCISNALKIFQNAKAQEDIFIISQCSRSSDHTYKGKRMQSLYDSFNRHIAVWMTVFNSNWLNDGVEILRAETELELIHFSYYSWQSLNATPIEFSAARIRFVVIIIIMIIRKEKERKKRDDLVFWGPLMVMLTTNSSNTTRDGELSKHI